MFLKRIQYSGNLVHYHTRLGTVPSIPDVNIFRSEKELGKKVALIKGDITKLKVDAVVNAANRPLRGGGGVDGAIHKAAGTQQLLSETKKLYPQGCLPGNAVITKGFNLPAKSKFSIAFPFIADVNIFRSEKELGKKVALIKGDITKLKVDAVVNAANRPLRGGGGVDGAIHKAAGTQQLLSETKKLYPQGCLPGNAVITKGFNLPAKSKFSIACNSPKSNHAPP
ncbi:hypothetical protein QYM36_014698 [Artemia franciscana]|uniref:Macro domain-containing protein n=1 Tax=Artemia franciscana TaxID=6661 RepID=A0AA88HKW9_ARTSF|nr:hypothetical protein QYM36_014698 [Artemia franciscana]